MKKRALPIVLVAAAILLTTAVASGAVAVPPDFCDDKPDHQRCTTTRPPSSTTTTEASAARWTCQARIDNGAMWNLGEWNGTAYVAGIASCTDILPDHLTVADWTVVWTGATQRGKVKGLKLVFEEQVHDNIFAEAEFTTPSGVWCPSLASDTALENMVFVAMPHSADEWTSFEVTVSPGHEKVCPD